MHGLAQDVRYAVRAMRRAPVFTAIAIGCLAIGIGVNAAAFSVLNGLLMRDLPGVQRQHELNTIFLSYETQWGRTGPTLLSPLDWDAFRGSIPAFAASAVMGTSSVALRVAGQPMAVRGDFMSGEFFAMLGTRPVLGRLLSDADDRVGAPPVVVISYDLWNREFGLAADVLGKPLYVGSATFTIVGVTPPGFVGLHFGDLVADPEHGAPFLVLPVAAAPLVRTESRYPSRAATLDDQWLLLAGRRRPGATEADVVAQAQTVAASLAAEHPRERGKASARTRAPTGASPGEELGAFAFVMAIPVLILLVACANLANQLLARGVQRGREIAVRLSLGATRARLVRLLLVESSLLAVAAGLAGILVARGLTNALGAFALVLPFRIPIDFRVLAFTLALAIVTALAFGLLPALRATRLDLAQGMKDGANTGGYRHSRLRSGLVVLQVAASVALLALSGIFARASQRSHILERAENVHRLLTVGVNLDLLGYSEAAGRAFQSLAMERLQSLPGVEAVARAPFGPVSSIPEARIALTRDGTERVVYDDVAVVAGDWFAARNVRPIAGRVFSPTDADGAVAVVDEAEAARLWPGANPIGQSVRIGDDSTAALRTVIGLIPTVRKPATEREGVITIPAAAYNPRTRFYVRTRGNAADLRVPVRSVMQGLDAKLPVVAIATLAESLEESGSQVEQMASGVGVMGVIALLLAALGLSSVLAFVVAQRRFEIGVRIALGAQRSAVTWMVLRQSLTLAVIGTAAGAVVAGAVATLLRNLLFGLPPIDPVAFAGSSAILLVVALLSSAAPARLAARVDPMVALRAD
jgi:macrolide transport system ATP-binding/permease protein